MVRHIVMWNFQAEFTAEQNKENALKVKNELEALASIIPGVIELKVYTDAFSSSNRDVILNSLFESQEALEAYVIHPEHKRVGTFVRAALFNRACIDFVE